MHLSQPDRKRSSKRPVVCVLAARMGSQRLPGKVLKVLPNGRTVFGTVLDACRQATTIDQIALVTTGRSEDHDLLRLAILENLPAFTGTEHDLLRVFREAAEDQKAQTVVRVTCDCPLLQPTTIDEVVQEFLKSDVDFAYNSRLDVGDGQDVEVMTIEALRKADQETKDPEDRSHVTPYLRTGPFTHLWVPPPPGVYRSLNTPSDWHWITQVYYGRTQ